MIVTLYCPVCAREGRCSESQAEGFGLYCDGSYGRRHKLERMKSTPVKVEELPEPKAAKAAEK